MTETDNRTMGKGNYIQLGELEIQYSVEQRDIERPRLEITPAKRLLILLPSEEIDERDIIESEREWISNQIISINDKISETGLEEERLADKIILGGEVLDLDFRNGTYAVAVTDRQMVVSTPPGADEISYLENWIRDSLRTNLTRLARKSSGEMDVHFNDIYIRKQKTKWGSCSSRKNLNFNLKSAALPDELLEYLVKHELTHLREQNHTGEFWKLLSEVCEAPRDKEGRLTGYWFIIHQCGIWEEFFQ